MDIRLNMPNAGEGTPLIVAGVGLVPNGDTFTVDKTLGQKLVKLPHFEEVAAPTEKSKGSEK